MPHCKWHGHRERWKIWALFAKQSTSEYVFENIDSLVLSQIISACLKTKQVCQFYSIPPPASDLRKPRELSSSLISPRTPSLSEISEVSQDLSQPYFLQNKINQAELFSFLKYRTKTCSKDRSWLYDVCTPGCLFLAVWSNLAFEIWCYYNTLWQIITKFIPSTNTY